ncbi:hypothetical protein BU23DRAFT_222173 [Bimuria novae-zelandiae CBS 107.79]|uniref:Uncharacterized protein n=1 Tax=Bimuria novae-zelandiae CBS 107.79 TaxID=1447943 RepID=A0A6A5VKX4_9PLEO|nr:hypothetical protein BU23DRAFT_222173 [Bimuria novae-zelandiae CBS 107.79]
MWSVIFWPDDQQYQVYVFQIFSSSINIVVSQIPFYRSNSVRHAQGVLISFPNQSPPHCPDAVLGLHPPRSHQSRKTAFTAAHLERCLGPVFLATVLYGWLALKQGPSSANLKAVHKSAFDTHRVEVPAICHHIG